MIKKLCIIINLALLCIFNNAYAELEAVTPNLPADLMHNGRPIDTSVIINSQYGGSERKEPQFVVESTHDSNYNIATNTVSKNYQYYTVSGRSVEAHESYKYIGTYNGKHVISTKLSDGGTGNFSTIGTIKRQEDYIVSVDEIAAGDRAFGGSIREESLHGSILNYRALQPYYDIRNFIDKNSTTENEEALENLSTLPNWPTSTGFLEFIKVDLSNETLDEEVYAIEFLERNYYTRVVKSSKSISKICFHKIALQYIDSNKCKITSQEAKEFAYRVAKCVKNSKKLN